MPRITTKEYADDLRSFADWLERNEHLADVVVPWFDGKFDENYDLIGFNVEGSQTPFSFYVSDVETLAAAARTIKPATKRFDSWTATVEAQLPHGTPIRFFTDRSNACEQVVVGTEEVEVEEVVVPAQTVTKTVTKNITEWKCNPILDDES